MGSVPASVSYTRPARGQREIPEMKIVKNAATTFLLVIFNTPLSVIIKIPDYLLYAYYIYRHFFCKNLTGSFGTKNTKPHLSMQEMGSWDPGSQGHHCLYRRLL